MEKIVVKKFSDRIGSNLIIGLITLVVLVAMDLFTFLMFSLDLLEVMTIVLVSVIMYLVLLFVLASTSKKISSITQITKDTKAPLDIPKYEYVGSTQARTYHSRNCRLAKLIKKKYKLMDNNPAFFVSKKFKPCKICLKKKN
ncbi:MAG: hypothetical protein WCK29_03605 [archaeon]